MAYHFAGQDYETKDAARIAAKQAAEVVAKELREAALVKNPGLNRQQLGAIKSVAGPVTVDAFNVSSDGSIEVL